MKEFILRENVLTDNTLYLPEEGKVFKGGYLAILHEYKFLNAWGDYKIVKKFRKTKTLNTYLEKNYGIHVIDGVEVRDVDSGEVVRV